MKAILNWYRENYDVMFVVPVLKRHFVAGVIVKKINKAKPKMSPEQSVRFFESLDIWEYGKIFAVFHFYMAGGWSSRIQQFLLGWSGARLICFENRKLPPIPACCYQNTCRRSRRSQRGYNFDWQYGS